MERVYRHRGKSPRAWLDRFPTLGVLSPSRQAAFLSLSHATVIQGSGVRRASSVQPMYNFVHVDGLGTAATPALPDSQAMRNARTRASLHLERCGINKRVTGHHEIEIVGSCRQPSRAQVKNVPAGCPKRGIEPKIKIRVGIAGDLNSSRDRTRYLSNADGVRGDARRRQVVPAPIAQLQFDGYGAATPDRFGRIVQKTNFVQSLKQLD